MNESIVVLLLLIGVGLVGLVALGVLIPIFFHAGALMEAFSLISEALSEYFNQPGLGRACCFGVFVVIAACCLLTGMLVVTGAQCFGANPPPICSVIGR